MKLHHALFAAVAAAAGLAGCGGSNYDEPAPVVTTEVPPSAYVSTAAYTSYAASLKPSETDKPLDVSKVVAPTSETEKPRAI